MPATTTTTTTTTDKPKKTRNRKPGAKVYRQADGSWLIRYKYTDRLTRKPVDIKRTARGRTKTEALAEARGLEREAIDAATRDPRAAKEPAKVPTVREFLPMFLDYCRTENKAPATVRNYNQHIVTYVIPVLGDRRLDTIVAADGVALKKKHSHLSQNTLRQTIAALNRELSVAALLGASPKLIRLPQIRKPEHKAEAYSPEHTAALLGGFESGRDLVMLYLGIVGGLRRGEVCAVQGVDFQEVGDGLLTLTVQRSIWGRDIRPTKTGKVRTLTLNADASKALREYTAELDKPQGWLFPGQRRDDNDDVLCVEPSAYVRVMARLCKHLGVPYKATHILRKTCATALAKAGLGPWAIADHLGHAGTEMAKFYVDRHHARNDRVAAALDAYTAGHTAQSAPEGKRKGERVRPAL